MSSGTQTFNTKRMSHVNENDLVDSARVISIDATRKHMQGYFRKIVRELHFGSIHIQISSFEFLFINLDPIVSPFPPSRSY